jgi:hypothetical protein
MSALPAEPMMTPEQAESGLVLLSKPTRIKVIEEWLQAPLLPETRAFVRRQYLALTDAPH